MADIDRFKLLVWELRQLAEDMESEHNPMSHRLEHIVGRWMTDIFDDR